MPIVNKLKQHKIILDTHVWLWLKAGSPVFRKDFLTFIENANDQKKWLVSAISIWEVGMLENKQKIKLDMDCLDWIEQALTSNEVEIIPLTPKIAIESTRLPFEMHGDPADRIIAASAHIEHAVLVTCDKKLLQCGEGQYISVYDPAK